MSRGLCLACALALASVWAGADDSSAVTTPPVFVLRVDGAIGPVTAEQVARSLERAARERAQLVVLQMDTPGGLDTAMRSIVKNILASPVPVAVFVSPQGARAASAGTYILYAAHLAAMAPATNLGAATPIAIGLPTPGAGGQPVGRPASAAPSAESNPDTSTAKSVNDATACIRGLAQLRSRDVAWAERAVRESVSLPAQDALSRHRRTVDQCAATQCGAVSVGLAEPCGQADPGGAAQRRGLTAHQCPHSAGRLDDAVGGVRPIAARGRFVSG